MKTLREELLYRSPKIFSNLVLVLIFWVARYIVLITLDSVSAELVFVLQTGLLIVTGIFLVRASFNSLIAVDRLIGSFLKRLGIKDGWSRQRTFKDILCIVAILLIVAGISPLFSLSTFDMLLMQIIIYAALGLILLFVFDIGRNFYKFTEEKANSVASLIINPINEDEETSEN